MRFKIDADSHYINPSTFQYVDKKYDRFVPKFEFDKDGRLIDVKVDDDPCPVSFNPLPFASHNRFAGISNIEKRLEDFQKLKVNFQILNPQEHSLRFSQLTERNLACEMAFSYNRTLLEIIEKYPTYFSGPIIIPLQDIDFSINELLWAKENRITSVIIDFFWIDNGLSVALPITEYPHIEKICRLCQDLDLTISLHGGMDHANFFHVPTFKKLKLNKFFPKYHKIGVLSLITSGLLDKFPKLKIVVNEGGMKFVSEGYRNLTSIGIDPSRYFKENLWFTIETEEEQELLSCIKLLGAERFLFATDYPHDDDGGENKFSDSDLFEKLQISENEKNLISWNNAKELFSLNNINNIGSIENDKKNSNI
jgi:predicted TIM-barrel fold metal-dependent hydrolase